MGRTDTFSLIALGANVSSSSGAPALTLHHAVKTLADQGIAIRAVSRFYRTPCFPAGAGPDYVNAALRVRWTGSSKALLRKLHEVEASFGRERLERWGDRSLDLDLLAVGQDIHPDHDTYCYWRDLPPDQQAKAAPRDLILPHPRIADRSFVLVPLCDIAADWVHPISGVTARGMLDRISPLEIGQIKPI